MIVYNGVGTKDMCPTVCRRCSLLGTNITMLGAKIVQWGDPADALLKAPDLQKALQDCSSTRGCALSMCYPCYCSLLSEVATGEDTNSWCTWTTCICAVSFALSGKQRDFVTSLVQNVGHLI
jgi:hypothetical protein